MIWIYLTDAYPTEADCRASFNTMDVDAEYLGVWHAPTPELPEVHVFGAGVDRDDLFRTGWVIA
jgi:hypothetical protein